MNHTQLTALRVAAALWVIWGVVHMFFGVAIMASDPSDAFAAIAAGVPADAVASDYHPAVAAILNQHGWNLLWFGAVTTVGGVMVWRRNLTAIWVSTMVGGLADIGYLTFVDIGGYGTFFPGTVMTLIAATATACGGWVWYSQRSSEGVAEPMAAPSLG